MSEFKLSRAFLEKVERGEVAETFGYSKRRGGHYGFRGGEKTARAYRAVGLVTWESPGLGTPGVARLTDKGREVLDRLRSGAA